MAHYYEAICIMPDLRKPNKNLGKVLFRQGEADEAIVENSQASRIAPTLRCTTTWQRRLPEMVEPKRPFGIWRPLLS